MSSKRLPGGIGGSLIGSARGLGVTSDTRGSIHWYEQILQSTASFTVRAQPKRRKDEGG
jgi:hypothetical protein